jgi:Ni/Co efflux regulator RcnB
MTNKLMIGALTAVVAVSAPLAASAQSWRHDNRHDRWDRRDDRRDDRRERRAYREGRQDGRQEYRRWHRGSTIPYNYRRNWYVSDYRRHGWRAPPRGYGYYRTDTGDIVVAALATGVILSLLNDY